MVDQVPNGFSQGLGNAGRFLSEGLLSVAAGRPAQQIRDESQAAKLKAQAGMDNSRIESLIQGATQLKQIRDPALKREFLVSRIGRLEQNGIDSSDSREALQMLDSGDLAGLESVTDQAISLRQQIAGLGSGNIQSSVIIPGLGAQTLTRDNRAGLSLLSPEQQKMVNSALEAEAKRKARGAGLKVGAEELAKIETAEELEIKKASGKAKGEAISAPIVSAARSKIESDIAVARAEGQARGETLTSLQQAQAGLPGLISVVDQLKNLAPIVTHTIAGKIMDTASKELGFGATKGSTAKAKFVAIINNQVLPLLKPTFGGSFSVQEGESLKATMGDPNSSPEEKIAQLTIIINSK